MQGYVLQAYLREMPRSSLEYLFRSALTFYHASKDKKEATRYLERLQMIREAAGFKAEEIVAMNRVILRPIVELGELLRRLSRS